MRTSALLRGAGVQGLVRSPEVWSFSVRPCRTMVLGASVHRISPAAVNSPLRRPLWLARISATRDLHGSAHEERHFGAATPAASFVFHRRVARSSTSAAIKKPGVEPGLPFSSERQAFLEGVELPVQASPDHREVVAIATVVEAGASKLAVDHRRTGVAHAHHVAAPDEAVVLPIPLKVDV